jgi:hypothetical protein
MKCFFILIILLFSFHVIGGGNLEGISLKKCVNLPSLSQINLTGFHNLRLVDLTEASPTIVENCIQE